MQLPPKLPNKFVVEFDEFKTINFRDRLRIFLGYNLLIKTKVVINRRSQKVQQRTDLVLTKEATAEGVVRENIQTAEQR